MTDIELVAIDLDGTLLREDRTIGKASKEAIAKVIRQDVKIVLCTARAPRNAFPYYKDLNLNTLLVTHNGALIQNERGKVLYHKQFEGQVARMIVDTAREISKKISIGVEVLDKFHGDGATGGLRQDPEVGASTLHKTNPERAARFEAVLDQPVTKVLMGGEPEVLGEVFLKLNETASEQVEFAFSHMRLLQIVRKGVSKGRSLSKVAEHYKIGRDKVMAIGDAPNDHEMLRYAGLGVAMGNAWTETLKTAQFTVGTNQEDGVAQALYRYVLKQ